MESNFKVAIETLRTERLVKRFPDNDLAWVIKFWYKSAIEYTKGRSAAQIEKNIINYIKELGHHAEKHSVTGREITAKDTYTPLGVIKGKKSYIPSQSQKGSADITATVYGVSLKIEVKKGKDRMGPEQIKYSKQIRAAGGFYFIAHDEEDFLTKFNEFLELPQIILMKQFKTQE
jgi:hypothetical protein